jgi:hypothetical protein
MIIFTPGRLTSGERNPGTRWIGGWMGLRVGLDAVAKKRNLCLCRELNPALSVCRSGKTFEIAVSDVENEHGKCAPKSE